MNPSAPTVAQLVTAYEELHPHAEGIGPSDVGKCRRELGYQLTKTEPDDGYEDSSPASRVGTLLHLALAHVGRAVLPTDVHVEASVQPPGLDRPGTVDLAADGTVTDYKTKGCHGWDLVAARGAPYEDDMAQLAAYGASLEDQGEQVDRLRVVYLNRCTGEEVEYVVPYDRAVASAGLMRLHAVLDVVDEGRADDLPRDGEFPGSRMCGRCPFRLRCWELTAPPSTSPGPLSAALPEQALAAAIEYRKTADRIEELEEEKGKLRERLRGWQGHVFTDDRGVLRYVSWSNPKPAEDVPDGKAAIALLRELGYEVPTKPGKQAAPSLTLRPANPAKVVGGRA